MWLNGRVYFVTDRDGVMNIWSMREDGSDLQQHTEHLDFDVRQPYQQAGRIVYHRAGDLWLYDIATGENRVVPITLELTSTVATLTADTVSASAACSE